MEGAEVAGEKGVGGDISRLIRLWKSVEKWEGLHVWGRDTL